MKWLAFADVHLEWRLYNIPELASDLNEQFQRFVDLAIHEKVEYVLNLGDLYEHPHPMEKTIAFVSEQIQRLKNHGITVVGITGDHDKSLNTETWIQDVNKASHPMDVEGFAGANYVDFFDLKEFADSLTDKKKLSTEWLMFHGCYSKLFSFPDKKKLLEFHQIDLSQFPNLKGIILGDIHDGTECTLEQGGKKYYIGYCGSLGVTRFDEADKKGLLCYDGNQLKRVPLPGLRSFVRVDFTKAGIGSFDAAVYEGFKKIHKKPVFLVEYDSETKDQLDRINFLYSIGYVRTSSKSSIEGKEEHVNIRSELGTNERIDQALKQECGTDDVAYQLTSKILFAADPKIILDQFKEESFKS